MTVDFDKLDERLARGEIDKAEFERLKAEAAGRAAPSQARLPVALSVLGWLFGVVALVLGLLLCLAVPSDPPVVFSALGFIVFGLACIPATRRFIPPLRSRTVTLATMAGAVALVGVAVVTNKVRDGRKMAERHVVYERIFALGDKDAIPTKTTRAAQFACMDEAFSAIAIEGRDGTAPQVVSMNLDENLRRLAADPSAASRDEKGLWADTLVHGLASICAKNGTGQKAEATEDFLDEAGINVIVK